MSFTSTCAALPVPVWPPRYANRYVRISRWIITIHYPVLMSGLILHVHNPILASFPCRCERWIVGKYNLHRQNTIAWNLLAALTSRILSADWDGRVKRIISPDLNYPDCRILESCNTTRGFFLPRRPPSALDILALSFVTWWFYRHLCARVSLLMLRSVSVKAEWLITAQIGFSVYLLSPEK